MDLWFRWGLFQPPLDHSQIPVLISKRVLPLLRLLLRGYTEPLNETGSDSDRPPSLTYHPDTVFRAPFLRSCDYAGAFFQRIYINGRPRWLTAGLMQPSRRLLLSNGTTILNNVTRLLIRPVKKRVS